MSQKVEQSLFEDTICFVGKLARLGRDLRHLVNVVHDLTARGIGLKVLTGHGASIDTTFPDVKLLSGIFAALAEFVRTKAGMAVARASGRTGGRPYNMAPSKLRLAVASMNQPETRIGDLCAEPGITLRMGRSIRPTRARRPFDASVGPTTPTRGMHPPASDGEYLPAVSKVRAPPPYASPKTSRGFAFLASKHLLS